MASATLFSCFVWTHCYKKKVQAEYRETLLGVEMADKDAGKESASLLGIGGRADTVTF